MRELRQNWISGYAWWREAPGRWPKLFWALDVGIAILTGSAICWLTLAIWGSAVIDVRIYMAYAHAFWFAVPPFHQFPVEYPPAALGVFSLALWPSLFGTLGAFTVWMAVILGGVYLLVVRYSGHSAALLLLGYLWAGAAPFLVARFDIVPTALTIGAFYAWRQNRTALAFALLVLGAFVKIYPAFLLPLLIGDRWCASLEPWNQRLRNLALELVPAAGICLVGIILPWWLNPEQAFRAFTTAGARPVQVETLWSIFIWLWSLLGHSTSIAFTFGSHNWVGPLSLWLATVAKIALVLGPLAVLFGYLRGWLTRERAFLATLCVVVLSNSVFSTQYLIWILPFVAIIVGFDPIWLLVCTFSLLETAYYPFNDPFSGLQVNLFMVLITTRDLLLVVATVRLFQQAIPPATARDPVPIARELAPLG